MKFILLLLITLPLFSDDYRIKHPKMHSQIESDKNPESKFTSPSLFKKIKYAFKNLINF
jgi:fumarate reductase subunit D